MANSSSTSKATPKNKPRLFSLSLTKSRRWANSAARRKQHLLELFCEVRERLFHAHALQ